MYSEDDVAPMRRELTGLGIKELRTPAEVDLELKDASTPILVVVNSICGCAGGVARPAVARALKSNKKPARLTSVFAGQDTAATAQARSYFIGCEPSSPSFALLKGGQVVHMIARESIQGKSPDTVAAELIKAFEDHC